jgi:hypothetical protein
LCNEYEGINKTLKEFCRTTSSYAKAIRCRSCYPEKIYNKIDVDYDNKIGYNNSMHDEIDDEEDDGYTQSLMPFLRIYLSAGRENHDMLDIDEIVRFLSSENRSISETIKQLIDKGMVNVYACSFNDTLKVL